MKFMLTDHVSTLYYFGSVMKTKYCLQLHV